MKSHKRYLLAVLTSALIASSISEAAIINGHDWVLNLEYRQFTPDNPPWSRRLYVCNADIAGNCEDASYWNSLTPDAGWETNMARVRLFDSGTNNLPTPPDGVPGTIEYQGYTLRYAGDFESATVMAFGPQGPIVMAQVARDTVLTYDAGTVIHEVSDPDDNKYVLFTAVVQAAELVDLTAENSLAALTLPEGWLYSSRTLTEALVVPAQDGVATVFSFPGLAFQRYDVAEVPLPGTAWLFGSALLGLGLKKRQRK